MSIRVGLRPMARPALYVPVVCAARGDMKVLAYGLSGTENKPGGWDAREVLKFLGFTVDTLAMSEPVPDLSAYSLVVMNGVYHHVLFSAAELAAIKALVEDQGASLLLLADTDVNHTLVPINQVAGIWGGAFGAILMTFALNPSAGQGGHDLWVNPTKGIGLQSALRVDSKITTIGTGFTQYADGVNKLATYREFPSGGRVVMGLTDCTIDHDGWLINVLKWLDGVEAEAFSDDFANLDDWTLTQQPEHSVTIVDGTWVRFKPIDDAVAGYSSIVHTLASPIAGDFLFAFNWRYLQPSNFSMGHFLIELLDADDNNVAYWYLQDSWGGSSPALVNRYCDTSKTTYAKSMPFSGHFRMSIFRDGDTLYFCSGVLVGGDGLVGSPYYRYGDCTRTVAKIKIRFNHSSTYWTVQDYYEVDKVSLWT